MFNLFCLSGSLDDYDHISASSVQYVKRSELLASAPKLPTKVFRMDSKRAAKQRKRSTVIGAPQDFRHNLHIGFGMDSETALKELTDTALWTHDFGYKLPVSPPTPPSASSSSTSSQSPSSSPMSNATSLPTPPSSSDSATVLFTQKETIKRFSMTSLPTSRPSSLVSPLPPQSSQLFSPSSTSLLSPPSGLVRRPSQVKRKPVPALVPERISTPEPIAEVKREEEEILDLPLEFAPGPGCEDYSTESDDSGVTTPADIHSAASDSVEVVQGADSKLRELLKAAALESPTGEKHMLPVENATSLAETETS